MLDYFRYRILPILRFYRHHPCQNLHNLRRNLLRRKGLRRRRMVLEKLLRAPIAPEAEKLALRARRLKRWRTKVNDINQDSEAEDVCFYRVVALAGFLARLDLGGHVEGRAVDGAGRLESGDGKGQIYQFNLPRTGDHEIIGLQVQMRSFVFFVQEFNRFEDLVNYGIGLRFCQRVIYHQVFE